MGDVLENLIRIIPIVIAIIWVMRRVSRKKSGQAKTPAKTDGKQAESKISEGFRNLEEKVTRAVRVAREEFPGESAPPPPVVKTPGKKIDKRRVSTGPPPEAVQGKRIVENLSLRETEGIYIDEVSNPLERIKNLPPLAQGMIWSFILDEPPALKEPKL
ncbi:MAG: hypothetical protein KAJ98_11875 [Spirochaetaceae bacterium]|nr:hypothetical protein [Spirochaetaceae bacterium]